MTTAVIERDEASGTSSNRYHHTRTVEIAGRTVRARVERDYYVHQSFAVVEVLNDQMTWTRLAAEAPSGGWWHNTPLPGPGIHAPARFLSPVTDRLLQRAAAILAPPTTRTISPHVHGAISALLATSYVFDAERRIEPDEIAWAHTHGGTLHIIEHGDGGVTFTKAHRDGCPFITSEGGQSCDDNCA